LVPCRTWPKRASGERSARVSRRPSSGCLSY
jgi:hypothetical protein